MPDLSFGTQGSAVIDFNTDTDEAHTLLVQPDGKIVVAGRAGNDFGVLRLHADGTLDEGFGSEGHAQINLNGAENMDHPDVVHAAMLLEDGRILLVGSTGLVRGSTEPDIVLVRMKADGSVDSTFATDGLAQIDFDDAEDVAYDLAVQEDGKIVVVGQSAASFGSSTLVVLRFTAEGALDSAFGTDGVARLEHADVDNGIGRGVALQSDGRIVVSGEEGFDGLVTRFTAEGALDTAFGSDGVLVLDGPAYDVALQEDGKIILGGDEGTSTRRSFYVMRLTSDGTADTNFGIGGTATHSVSTMDFGHAIALQEDGAVVLAGRTTDSELSNFAIVRFNPDGTVDAGFGESGVQQTDLGNDYREGARAVTIDGDGDIVAAGLTFGQSWDFAVTRYGGGTGSTAAENVEQPGPRIQLQGAAPNPFGHRTTIRYSLSHSGHVRLDVFDLLGRRVTTLVDQVRAPGMHEATLDAGDLPAGMYLCRLQTGDHTVTRRLVHTR